MWALSCIAVDTMISIKKLNAMINATASVKSGSIQIPSRRYLRPERG